MTTAPPHSITGASRGPRPRPRHRARRPRLAARRRRPGRRPAGRRRRRAPRPELVTAVPGDVADPRTAPHWPTPSRPAARPARQQRQRPRPQPAAAARRPRRSTSFRRVLAVNTVAPLALVQAAPAGAAARAAARVVNISSDAAVEAYAGWGGYGASKAALDQLTAVLAVEEPELRVVRRRPRRHGHRHAPGRLPGRGHQRPAGTRRPSSRRCCGWSTATCPSGRYRAAELRCRRERRPDDRDVHPPGRMPTATAPPEWRGLPRDEVRLWPSGPAASTTRRFRDLAGPARARRPRRGQHLGDPARPAAAARRADGAAVPAARGRPRWTTALGGRAAASATTAAPTSACEPGTRPRRCPAASGSRCSPATPTRPGPRGCGGPAPTRRRRRRPTCARTGAPIGYGYLRRRRSRSPPSRTSTPPSPAAPRWPAPGGRSPTRLLVALMARGVAGRPAGPAHRCLQPRAARAAAARAVRRPGGHRPAGEQHPARPAAGWSPSARRSPARWRPATATDGVTRGRRGLDRPRARPRPARPRRRPG